MRISIFSKQLSSGWDPIGDSTGWFIIGIPLFDYCNPKYVYIYIYNYICIYVYIYIYIKGSTIQHIGDDHIGSRGITGEYHGDDRVGI